MPLIPQAFIEFLILCQPLFEAMEVWGPTWKHVDPPVKPQEGGMLYHSVCRQKVLGSLRDILWELSV